MKDYKVIVTLALFLAGAAWFTAQGAGGPSRPAAKPTAVAVADVKVIFDGLEEKKTMEAELNGMADRLNAESQARQKRIQELQQDLDLLVPGTPPYIAKQNERERQAIELNVWRQLQTNKMTAEQVIRVEAIYRKILDAIGKAARDGGYDLVLFKEPAVDFSQAKPENLSALIAVRKVLYTGENLDLTNPVIQLMNNEFKFRSPATQPGR